MIVLLRMPWKYPVSTKTMSREGVLSFLI
jgi:hypothetical protein